MKVLFDNFEGIGMDFSKYLPSRNNGTVYHYTSLSNWKNILLPNNKSNAICLWASRIDSLNDYMENQFATKIYKNVLQEMAKENSISLDQRTVLESITSDPKIPMKDGNIEKYIDCDIYVLCFSKHSDLLNMWKYYSKGNGYEAVNIGLSSEFVNSAIGTNSPYELIAFPVVYDEEAQKYYIRSFLCDFIDIAKNIGLLDDVDFINTFVADALSMWNVLFKSSCFSDEQEVRAVLYLPKKSGEIIQYRTTNQLVVPYIVHSFDKNCVKEIVLGPLDDKSSKQNISVLQEALETKFPDINISSSQITLRF